MWLRGTEDFPAITLFEAKCEMGFKSLSARAVTLLMEAWESHRRENLIRLAQMLQISPVIMMVLAF